MFETMDRSRAAAVVDGLEAAQPKGRPRPTRALRQIVEADRLEVWREWGVRDMAHWLAMRYDVSEWKTRRWIAAAHALEDLPLIAEVLAYG